MNVDDLLQNITSHPSNDTRYAIERAASILLDGGIVIFPTETVYGVGACADNPVGIQQLRNLKGRTDGKPFTVHIGNPERALEFLSSPSRAVQRLIRRAFPGPITLLLPESDPSITPLARRFGKEVLKEIYCDGYIGIRCPEHTACRELLSMVDSPIVAASANLPGDPPPATASEAMEQIGDSVDLILDAGPCKLSNASTIARISESDTIEIVREGKIDRIILEKMMEMHILFVCTGNTCRSPMAEALCAHHLQEKTNKPTKSGYRVASAGVMAAPGYPASDGAVKAMRSRGINLENHRSRPLTRQLANDADAIYCMTQSHRQGVLSIAPEVEDRCFLLAESDIDDPIGGSLEVYERCAKQIETGINKIFQEESR